MEDIYGFDKQLKGAEKLLEASSISKSNKELIRKFKRYLEINNYSKSRILKYLIKLRIIAEIINKDYDRVKKEDIENFVLDLKKRKFNDKEISDTTKKDYIILLKRFFKWLKGKDEEYPEEVKWIKSNFKDGNKKLPEDLLNDDDVALMIKNCNNIRDKAIISILYDSGMRIGELLSCRIKDVKFDKEYATITNPSGKTGGRRMLLVPSVPYLVNWIENHPLGKRDDYLFVSLSNKNQFQPLNHQSVNMMIKKVGKKCKIAKRISCHQFRHASATKSAKFMTDAQLKQRFGWVQSSKMSAVYIHMSGRDTDEAVKKMYGKEVKKEEIESKIEPKKCVYCETINGFDNKYCRKCGRPLSLEIVMEIDKKRKRSDDFMNWLKDDPEWNVLLDKKIEEYGLKN